MDIIFNLVVLVFSYLLGSINTSIIISKIMLGDDIRNHGSGNAGATNALRTIGKKGALFVVLGDIIKTVISITLAQFLLEDNSRAIYIAGIGTVLGHNFPLYFRFKGGKGIIVSTVTILFADPVLGLITVLFAISVMAIWKYVSLGSILGAIMFLLLALVFRTQNLSFVVFSAILALLAIYMHKSNIVRLIAGTENKLSFNKMN